MLHYGHMQIARRPILLPDIFIYTRKYTNNWPGYLVLAQI